MAYNDTDRDLATDRFDILDKRTKKIWKELRKGNPDPDPDPGPVWWDLKIEAAASAYRITSANRRIEIDFAADLEGDEVENGKYEQLKLTGDLIWGGEFPEYATKIIQLLNLTPDSASSNREAVALITRKFHANRCKADPGKPFGPADEPGNKQKSKAAPKQAYLMDEIVPFTLNFEPGRVSFHAGDTGVVVIVDAQAIIVKRNKFVCRLGEGGGEDHETIPFDCEFRNLELRIRRERA